MANEKTRDANWAIARARWEGEPRCSFPDLTDFLQVSKQAIAKRAKRDGWVKKLTMSTIVDKAHAAADRNLTKNAATLSKGTGAVVANKTLAPLTQTSAIVPAAIPDSKNATPDMLAQAVEEVAVDARAQVLTRHRNEWPAARNHIYKALKTGDTETAKLAKIAAETLKLVQDGERKAWGLDAGDTPPGSVKIVIERTEGVRAVR